MFNIEIIAVGRLKKNSAFYSLFDDYTKRLNGKFNLIELEGKSQADENQKILEKIDPQAALVVMDERGKSLKSIDLSKKLEELQQAKNGKIQFVIGGADGLLGDVRQKADFLMCFGQQTWPHMLARVMLSEQIYRAQQILANHPYHRE
jgi:23S rRNA (pseudouridine1915-N3)-methyltransferase